MSISDPEQKERHLLYLPRPVLGFYLLCVVAALLLYPAAWPGAPFHAVDTGTYMLAAQRLQSGAPSTEMPARTIGYPLMLLLTGSSTRLSPVLFYVQLSMYLIVTLLAAILLYRLGLRRILIYLFLVFCLAPFTIRPAANALTEAPTAFLLGTGIVGLFFGLQAKTRIRLVWLMVSGVSLAVSALIRPVNQLLPLLIPTLLIGIGLHPLFRSYRRRIFSAAFVVALCGTAILGAQVVYNRVQYGYAELSYVGGLELSTRTWRLLEYLPDQAAAERDILLRVRNELMQTTAGHHGGEMVIWSALDELTQATKLSRPALSEHMLRLNVQLIFSYPDEYLKEVLRAMAIIWSPSTEFHGWNRLIEIGLAVVQSAVIAAFLFSTLMTISLTLIACTLPAATRQAYFFDPAGLRWRWSLLLIILGTIGYIIILSTMLDAGDPRYRAPTDLLITLALVLEVDTLLNIRKRLKRLPVSTPNAH